MSGSNPSGPHIADSMSSPAAIAKVRSLTRPTVEVRRFVSTISPLEIAAAVIVVVTAIAVVLVYVYSVLPGQVKSSQLSSAQAANAKTIDELRAQVQDPTLVRAQFNETIATLEQFRGEYLKPRLSGRIAIVRDVDRLTHSAGVTLNGGVDFSTTVASVTETDTSASDESRDKKKSRSTKTKKSDSSSAYSSLHFALSVSGRYDRLRKFIGEFERSPQFVVIESIDLVPSDGGSKGKRNNRGAVEAEPADVLTLKINLTAYFQPQSGWEVSEEIAASDTSTSGA